MDNAKICPACKRENRPTESICVYCGTALVGVLPNAHMSPGLVTEPVSDVPVKVKHPEHIIQLTKLYADIVVLTVLGQEQPVLIKGGGRIMLGRYSPGDVTPSVDLTPYNASLLGVSRQHAVITRPEKTYLLQDLGSTNGTWLNEVKLTPNKPYSLQSGDLIRLGQLALYVYFDMPKPDEVTTVELVLQKIGDRHLTPTDLNTQIMPYLNALAGLQKVCDTVLERATSEVSVLSMAFDPETGKINFKLTGAAEAVRLVKTKLVDVPVVPQLAATTTSVSSLSGTSPGTGQLPGHQNGETNASESLSGDARIAADMVNDLAPFRSDEYKKESADKLLPFIGTLKTNPLTVIAD